MQAKGGPGCKHGCTSRCGRDVGQHGRTTWWRGAPVVQTQVQAQEWGSRGAGEVPIWSRSQSRERWVRLGNLVVDVTRIQVPDRFEFGAAWSSSAWTLMTRVREGVGEGWGPKALAWTGGAAIEIPQERRNLNWPIAKLNSAGER